MIVALSPWLYFTDSVLRGPTIGCMLMCLVAALVGVVVFLKKQSLLGEALSHASYPGVILGVTIAGGFSLREEQEGMISFLIMVGAFFSALFGLVVIHLLERKLRIKSDAALCFVLSAFFGVGVTFASHIQFQYPVLYRQVVGYLYGQAATMTDFHIWIYLFLAIVVIFVTLFFYKEIQILTFDRDYANTLGVKSKLVDSLTFLLIVFAVVIGIRSVGVVLMSAMLIAPVIGARQFSNRLYVIMPLAAFFGVVSGYLGNYFSTEGSLYLMQRYPGERLSLPTGPMIVMVASAICVFALFFAPERGLVVRLLRIGKFRYRCLCENLLKSIWRFETDKHISFHEIIKHQSASPLYLSFVLSRLVHQGWLEKSLDGFYRLTLDGEQRAAKIVRLHRLWEVYLVNYVGLGVERVHRNAEEMEHIITPELEEELTLLLKDPKQDPHQQPIPPRDDL